MSRTLTGAMSLALAENRIAPIAFAELDFLSGFVRMWNGVGSIVWDGKTWLGGGNLIGISQVEETRSIEATTLTMSLSGVNPALVSQAYGDFSQGRPARTWVGLMDVGTGTVVEDPVNVFAGRMDTISDEDDGVSAIISVSAESNLADLKRIRARYYTDQDQQRIKPGDRSLRFIPSLQEKPVYWGVREGAPQIQQTTF